MSLIPLHFLILPIQCRTAIDQSRRRILRQLGPHGLVQDQRFVEHRPDVLTWQTDPLTEDVAVTGDIVADLFSSTTGTDSDWIVKLSRCLSRGLSENHGGSCLLRVLDLCSTATS